ncbi:uncharacterized protein BXZ73DRAFT_108405 [Epithele typhae]|uniref:uncharacterized protein n=1 Tax=Epithele typhae TaxID=378194 RepID=UPI00200763BB|nr:uncharacterized protein BXZ73DRAFT_108405 [Epithele typhae]KAH9910886.1 hypothetical protein BXZ73DRAFT_108405 [Epithele typhae]
MTQREEAFNDSSSYTPHHGSHNLPTAPSPSSAPDPLVSSSTHPRQARLPSTSMNAMQARPPAFTSGHSRPPLGIRPTCALRERPRGRLKAVSRPEGDESRICGKDGRVLLEIIILDAVPADSVKWGHALASVTRTATARTPSRSRTGAPPSSTSSSGATAARRASVRSSPRAALLPGLTGAEIVVAPDVVDRADMADRARWSERDDVRDGGCKMLIAQRNSTARADVRLVPRPGGLAVPADAAEARACSWRSSRGGAGAPEVRRARADDGIYHRPLYMLPPGLGGSTSTGDVIGTRRT